MCVGYDKKNQKTVPTSLTTWFTLYLMLLIIQIWTKATEGKILLTPRQSANASMYDVGIGGSQQKLTVSFTCSSIHPCNPYSSYFRS